MPEQANLGVFEHMLMISLVLLFAVALSLGLSTLSKTSLPGRNDVSSIVSYQSVVPADSFNAADLEPLEPVTPPAETPAPAPTTAVVPPPTPVVEAEASRPEPDKPSPKRPNNLQSLRLSHLL